MVLAERDHLLLPFWAQVHLNTSRSMASVDFLVIIWVFVSVSVRVNVSCLQVIVRFGFYIVMFFGIFLD